MRTRQRRFRLVHLAAATTAFAMAVVTTLSWAWTGGVDQIGLPMGAPGDPTVSAPAAASSALPEPGVPVIPDANEAPAEPDVPAAPAPTTTATALGGPRPAAPGASRGRTGVCRTGVKLVPTCGILWGVAPGAFTDQRGRPALASFEQKTQRHQDIYHAYHRGLKQLFPTRQEIAIAREEGRERILFLNWKPVGASWAEIAKGDKKTDAFLDRLARHINENFPEDFFFTVHHEAEDNVKEKPGSGYTARDYAAMFRYVVERLRAHGVDNLVTVLVHMAYVPHTTKSWFHRMYPGDDVVDWIGFDTYAYSDPGYGHGDFAELLNRRMESKPAWPGFYNWAVTRHPDKPLMVAEWGVWSSKRNPGHKAEFYREVGRQIGRFPNIRAMVHFDTPHNQKGMDSRVDATRESLAAYRRLGRMPIFQVEVSNGLS
ncbi:MAG TPA: glycosyl hydrolase [Actinoplanes sp.]|nr:glycosyl hydrolase [Actinoplanes sp.]